MKILFDKIKPSLDLASVARCPGETNSNNIDIEPISNLHRWRDVRSNNFGSNPSQAGTSGAVSSNPNLSLQVRLGRPPTLDPVGKDFQFSSNPNSFQVDISGEVLRKQDYSTNPRKRLSFLRPGISGEISRRIYHLFKPITFLKLAPVARCPVRQNMQSNLTSMAFSRTNRTQKFRHRWRMSGYCEHHIDRQQ